MAEEYLLKDDVRKRLSILIAEAERLLGTGGSATRVELEALQERIDNLVLEGGTGDLEVVDARFSSIKDKLYTTLTNRLDSDEKDLKDLIDGEIAENRKDFDGKVYDSMYDAKKHDLANIYDRFNKANLIEYTGTYITAKNSYKGILQDLSIKGRTLQNIYKKIVPYVQNGILSNEGDIYKCTANVESSTTYLAFELPSDLLKNNTTYTMRLDNYVATQSTGQAVTVFDRTAGVILATRNGADFANGTATYDLKKVIPGNRVQILLYVTKTVGAYTQVDSKIMFLEGDYTKTPLSDIPYIEGIKSVGEEEGNKIEVESVGKNLFDVNNFVDTTNSEYYSVKDNVISILKLDSRSDKVQFKKRIRVKPNTDYTLKTNQASGVLRIFLYEQSKVLTVVDYKFNTLNNEWIDIKFVAVDVPYPVEVKNIQLEEGIKATTVVPYQSTKEEIQLTEPLRSLPNGVSDEIKGGEYIKRINKFTLTSTMTIILGTDELTNTMRFQVSRVDAENSLVVRCDKIPNTGLTTFGNDMESCQINNKTMYIRILKSKLPTKDVAGFKKWLETNPMNFEYQLSIPTITQLNTITLNSYDETTHVTSGNYIMPTITAKVPSNTQAIIAELQIENEELKRETKKQDEAININLYATDEMYFMLKPILEGTPKTLEEDGEEVVDRISDLHQEMIRRGLTPLGVEVEENGE